MKQPTSSGPSNYDLKAAILMVVLRILSAFALGFGVLVFFLGDKGYLLSIADFILVATYLYSYFRVKAGKSTAPAVLSMIVSTLVVVIFFPLGFNNEVSAVIIPFILSIVFFFFCAFVPSRFWAIVSGLIFLGYTALLTVYFSLFSAHDRVSLMVCGSSLVLTAVGITLGLAIQSVFNRTLHRMTLISRMCVAVNRNILINEESNTIYQLILDYLFKIFPKVTFGSILVIDDVGALRIVASRGYSPEFIQDFRLNLQDSFLYRECGGQITKTCLISRETLGQSGGEPLFESHHYRSVISSPVFLGDRLFGLLNLDSDNPRAFTADDVQLVEEFSDQIEVSLLAREHYRKTLAQSQIDGLTGFHNRKHFEELFHLSLALAQRKNESLVLALFDADGLKQANDTLGHLAGDRLLAAIADTLKESRRESDFVGRIGGDEFTAVYHNATLPSIDKLLDKKLTAARDRPLAIAGTKLPVSFSYGLARFPDDGSDLAALLAVADKRMYKMKLSHKRSG